MISLDRDALAAVDVPTMQDKVNKQFLKKENIGITNETRKKYRKAVR